MPSAAHWPCGAPFHARIFRPIGVLLAVALLLPGALAAQNSSADNRPAANWDLSNKFTTQALQRVTYSSTLTPRWIGKTDSMWYNWRNRAGRDVLPGLSTDEDQAAAIRPREARRRAGDGAPEAVRAERAAVHDAELHQGPQGHPFHRRFDALRVEPRDRDRFAAWAGRYAATRSRLTRSARRARVARGGGGGGAVVVAGRAEQDRTSATSRPTARRSCSR